VIPYHDIPNMITTTVVGHSGNVIIGGFNGVDHKILCFSGRNHAYEGGRLFEVIFLAQIANALGCKIFIATNAAGKIPKIILLNIFFFFNFL
jgi:purine-nucleoside phosphorylase